MINTVALMGRICHDLELKHSHSGISVLHFTIAVDRKYQKQGQDKQTDFIDCVCFSKTAEFVDNYFTKGDLIAIEGELHTSKYQDKNGNNRKSTDIAVNQVSFCGSKQGNNTDTSSDNDFEDVTIDEDLTF